MKTEQDIIDGNIVLHNYFTGKEWRHDEYKVNKLWLAGSERKYVYIEPYNEPDNFYSLWQVLQKIDKDREIYKWWFDSRWVNKLSGQYSYLQNITNWAIRGDSIDLADPVDIFWAAVELIKEYNKYLNSAKS